MFLLIFLFFICISDLSICFLDLTIFFTSFRSLFCLLLFLINSFKYTFWLQIGFCDYVDNNGASYNYGWRDVVFIEFMRIGLSLQYDCCSNWGSIFIFYKFCIYIFEFYYYYSSNNLFINLLVFE